MEILSCVCDLPYHPSHPVYDFKFKIESHRLKKLMAPLSFLQIDPELEKKLKMNKVSLESEYEVHMLIYVIC